MSEGALTYSIYFALLTITTWQKEWGISGISSVYFETRWKIHSNNFTVIPSVGRKNTRDDVICVPEVVFAMHVI